MKVSKSLNLVVDVQREDGSVVYVHSTPISRDVFNAYYSVIAMTFNSMYRHGLGAVRIAALELKANAERMDAWAGAEGVERGLLGDIKRLTLVICPQPGGGWGPVPYEEAVQKGILDDEDAAEVENALAFFTVSWSMHLRMDRQKIVGDALKLWGARLSSLSTTEFVSSLRTSTQAAATTETPPAPQVTTGKAVSSAPF